jgi:hypothetical protein
MSPAATELDAPGTLREEWCDRPAGRAEHRTPSALEQQALVLTEAQVMGQEGVQAAVQAASTVFLGRRRRRR